MSRNKNIMVAVVLIFFLATAFYMYKNKKVEQPNNNQQQQQKSDDQNKTNTTDDQLKSQILELVGKANSGKKDEALMGYLNLLKDYPTNLTILNNIAVLYNDMGDWNNSETYYKILLQAHPDYINGYRMLGYLYQYRFNDDEAKIKALFDAGIKANNNEPQLVTWMISYYKAKGETDKALPYSQLLGN